MLFPTVTFAIFFAVVLPVSWLLMPHQRAWTAWILAASYFFYAWWDWRYVLLLGVSTVVSHLLAVAIYRTSERFARKFLLGLAISFDLGLLAYFKYANFFITTADDALGRSWLLRIGLPVGISFYTFMAISYVVDTYRAIPGSGTAAASRALVRPQVLPRGSHPRRRTSKQLRARVRRAPS